MYSPDEIKYFTDSVLFFIQDPDPKVNQVMISYITGAILPIVALCMTSMIVDVSGIDKEEKLNEVKIEDPKEIDEDVINELNEWTPQEVKNEEKEEKNTVVF
jgi:hypothetical protein